MDYQKIYVALLYKAKNIIIPDNIQKRVLDSDIEKYLELDWKIGSLNVKNKNGMYNRKHKKESIQKMKDSKNKRKFKEEE